MLLDLLMWWYGEGWLAAWRAVPRNIKKVMLTFTLPVLVRTLFSPWKRIISPGGRSLEEKFQAMMDNLFSRVIGFFVRLGVLMMAAVMIIVAGVLGLAIAV